MCRSHTLIQKYRLEQAVRAGHIYMEFRRLRKDSLTQHQHTIASGVSLKGTIFYIDTH